MFLLLPRELFCKISDSAFQVNRKQHRASGRNPGEGLPYKKDRGARGVFSGVKKQIWYLLERSTSKGLTTGAFAVPFKVVWYPLVSFAAVIRVVTQRSSPLITLVGRSVA